MATTLTVESFQAAFNGSFRNDDAIAPASVPLSVALTLTLAQGTGADQADLIYVAQRTLSANTAENLDLAGVLTSPLGATLTFARVKLILVKLYPSPAGGPLRVGGHATAAFGTFFHTATDLDTDQPKIVLRNGTLGAWLALGCTDATGYVVTATTEDLLTVNNTHATLQAKYDIVLVGSSV